MSVAILTRIYKYESPYINEFIDYHLNHIKVNHIYFILTDNYNFINVIDKSFLKNISLLKNPIFLNKNVDLIFNYTIPFIKEKYVFNIDVDEFIILNKCKSLEEFIKKNSSYNLFHFKWIIAPSNNYQNNSVFKICENEKMYISKMGKSMAVTNKIISVMVHSMLVLKENSLNVNINEIFIMHFSSRGIVDLILRMINQKFKTDTLENINYFLDNDLTSFKLLPSRIKAMILQKNYKYTFNKKFIFPKLKFGINNELENIFLSEKIIMNEKRKLFCINNVIKKYNDFELYKKKFKKSLNMTQFLKNFNKNKKTKGKIINKNNTKKNLKKKKTNKKSPKINKNNNNTKIIKKSTKKEKPSKKDNYIQTKKVTPNNKKNTKKNTININKKNKTIKKTKINLNNFNKKKHI
jgi:hypothetical protein